MLTARAIPSQECSNVWTLASESLREFEVVESSQTRVQFRVEVATPSTSCFCLPTTNREFTRLELSLDSLPEVNTDVRRELTSSLLRLSLRLSYSSTSLKCRDTIFSIQAGSYHAATVPPQLWGPVPLPSSSTDFSTQVVTHRLLIADQPSSLSVHLLHSLSLATSCIHLY